MDFPAFQQAGPGLSTGQDAMDGFLDVTGNGEDSDLATR